MRLTDSEIRKPYLEEEKAVQKYGFTPELIEDIYKPYPDVWIKRFIRSAPWYKQIEICRALYAHDKISVRSCNGAGKSWTLAALSHHFFQCYHDSKFLTTAPTIRQVKKVLWAEIGKQHQVLCQTVARPGELLQTELRDSPSHWGLGFSTDESDKVQGYHELNMLLIFDEANGIPREIYQAAKGLTTSKGNKVVLIGNPTAPNTFFHETQTGDQPGYYRIHISAYDIPNIKVNSKGEYYEPRPLPYPKLSSLAWINDMLSTYGRTHPEVVSRVYGEFPASSSHQLISDELIALALEKGALLRKITTKMQNAEEVVPAEMVRDLQKAMRR